MKQRMLPTVLLLLALLMTPSLAADQELMPDDVFCFSQTDFATDSVPGGIVLTDVPGESLGSLYLGSRQLRAGDALTGAQLSEMTFVPSGAMSGDAVISCLAMTEDGTLTESEVTIKIGSDKNEPPVAEDSEFTTYKNISGVVSLNVSDPEGDELTVTIVKAPKRGNVDIAADGTVTYTPTENKVGKDSFTYTVTDTAGNTSEEAKVRIVIEKPSDKQTYGDLKNSSILLAATWLREKGIYCGETISGQLLFQPEETVTRGEFIAMCVGLTGLDEDAETLTTGFVDEAETPEWLSPYVSTALRCGYITGVPTEDGLALNAGGAITQAEAAKMVSSLLQLPESGTEPVFAESDSIPAWASGAVSAMTGSGLYTVYDAEAPLTRGEAATLIFGAWQRASREAENNSLLAWAQE